MVDWQFLPRNFGAVVGTYEGLFVILRTYMGWWFYVQVVGTPEHFLS